MNIILNHTLRSIKDNKVQVALIVATIAVVTFMIFIALSMTGLFYNININAESRLAADTDIVIRGELFSKAKIDDYISKNKDAIEYVDYYLQLAGLVRMEQQTKIIMLEAADFRTLYQRHSNKLSTVSAAKENFEYPAIWIGKDFAEDLGVGIGETIEIYYQGSERYQKFSISRIMRTQGYFADVSVNNILVDYSSITSRGMVNTAFIKLKSTEDYSKVTEELKQFINNDGVEIASAIDYQRITQIVKNNTNLLNVALAFIMTIMGLILLTSYLVIAKKRINEMIIFKAAGATPMQTTLIMLSEVILYGIIGAVIGLIMGRIGMGLIVKTLLPTFPNAVTYNLWKYIVALFVGVIISIISALVPIIRISRRSIREMSSGIVKDIRYIKPYIIILLTLMVGVCFTLLILYDKLVVTMTIALIILFSFWIYFVVPYVIKWLSFLFSKRRGQSSLAAISIKRNTSTNTLSILVGAVITFSFIVVSVINLIVTALIPYNTRFNAEYVINSSEEMQIESLSEELSLIDGIKNIAYFRTSDFDMKLTDNKRLTYQVIGINNAYALRHAIKGISQAEIEKFEKTTHPVILNYDMARRLNLNIGDQLDIELKHPFTVVGIDYTVTEYDRLMYVNLDDLIFADGEQVAYKDEKMFIASYDNADQLDLYLSIRDKLASRPQFFVLMYQEWAFATSKGLSGITALLRLVQILVSFVAFVGVINLTIVTFSDRKKEYNIYKSSGMSVKKFNSLSLYESLIIAISGGIIGIILSFFFNSLMPSFAQLINKYLIYSLFPLNIPIISIIVIMVYTLIYGLISMSNKKLYLNLSFYNQRDNL